MLQALYIVESGGEGPSNKKVTYMCLPEYESRGIWCNISLEKGGHSLWAPKMGVVLWVPKNEGHSVWENTIFIPKFAI